MFAGAGRPPARPLQKQIQDINQSLDRAVDLIDQTDVETGSRDSVATERGL